jgi:hypothetical protein
MRGDIVSNMPKRKTITNNPDTPVIVRLYGGKAINLTPGGAENGSRMKKVLPERIMKKPKKGQDA